jgi:hypothetical protein
MALMVRRDDKTLYARVSGFQVTRWASGMTTVDVKVQFFRDRAQRIDHGVGLVEVSDGHPPRHIPPQLIHSVAVERAEPTLEDVYHAISALPDFTGAIGV